MGKIYTILGSGRQGQASAYDMALFGNTDKITMADIDLNVAQNAANNLNKLANKNIATAQQLDIENYNFLVDLIKGTDCVLSAVPYYFNVDIAKACIEAKVNMCDLGGNTHIVLKELELDKDAKNAGITIVPDCGLMPGMGNIIAVYGINKMDMCKEVQVRCGGIPQNPKPPLGYKLVFNIEGLTNEYFGKAYILRNSKVTEIDTFCELENIEFSEPVGLCEAFTTTGGTSTCPWTYEGKIEKYEYKTVRYPGHYEKIKTMLDLGLLDTEPVDVNGYKISPRNLFHKVVPPKILFPDDKDLVVLRVMCKGFKDGKELKVTYNLIDFQDENFSAMERTTGFAASIVAIMLSHGEIDKGAIPLEKTGIENNFIKEILKRCFDLKETITMSFKF